MNEDKTDNRPSNLVICQDNSYHMLLHRRLKALRGCGNPDGRMCSVCKRWDRPENLWIHPSRPSVAHHRECVNRYQRAQRRAS